LPPDSQDVQDSRFEQFASLFPVRTDSKFRRPESSIWRSMSQFHTLSDDEIFDSLQAEANFIRTCSIDRSTRFSVIGIPADSIYSNPRRIAVITDLLKNVGLQPVLFGSPTCDEIQIYLFFKEIQKTNLITQALNNLLIGCGLQVSFESLFVYCEDQDLVLPLQQGFSWLTDSLQSKVCRNEIAFECALAMFMSEFVKSSTHVDQLLNFQSGVVNSQKSNEQIQNDFAPSLEVSILINQEPETPRISLIEEVPFKGLIDQSEPSGEVLITQTERIDDGRSVKLTSKRKTKDAALLQEQKDAQYKQMTLPVLDKPKVESKKSNRRKARDRRTKRGPPDQ